MSDTCFICGSENEHQLETHHIVPRRFGGSDADENLVDLCSSCHTAVEKMYDSRFYEVLGVKKPVDDLDAELVSDEEQLEENAIYVLGDSRELVRYSGELENEFTAISDSDDAKSDPKYEFHLISRSGIRENEIIDDIVDISIIKINSEINPIKLQKRLKSSDKFFESILSVENDSGEVGP